MHRSALAIAALCFPLSACVDLTGTTGELGRIGYQLATDYDMGPVGLAEASVLTGHEQTLQLDLTDRGLRAAHDLRSVHHSVTPAAGVRLRYERENDYLGEIDILVEDPGTYTLTTEVDGAVFDFVTLHFDTPATLDAVTWVRQPGAEEFERVGGDGRSIAEGSQISFVPIPLDADGLRIAGVMDIEIGSDPEGAVVPAFDSFGTYEDGVYGSLDASSVYVIEAGALTVTLDDLPNAVTFSQAFDVR